MQFSAALDDTFRKFEIKNVDISFQCDVSPSRISRLRSGTPIKSNGLEQILDTLEDEALLYFFSKLVRPKGLYVARRPSPEMEETIENLTKEEAVDMLAALVQKIRTDEKN